MFDERKIVVSYVCTLPLIGNSPNVIIYDKNSDQYIIEFINNDTNEIVNTKTFKSNEFVYGERQWFINWLIKIYDSNKNLIYTDKFNPIHKNIFIKMDAHALGDNIAWIQSVEEFRKKYKCNVICSTFHNDLFIDSYPNILFVKPNTVINNVYSQYYIGANNSDNIKYSPVNSEKYPLQKISTSILGLDDVEIVPDLISNLRFKERRLNDKYICISEYGSHEKKMWKEGLEGWQYIVDKLNDEGYKVCVISREPTKLKNIIDWTGDINLKQRMIDLYYSEFFIGVSSGLSWLSWSVGTKVIMISDCTPEWHEFKTKMVRICENKLDKVDYEVEGYSKKEKVFKIIKSTLK
jgi:autotransporter strand-loop-strand O-heptosyltransferase